MRFYLATRYEDRARLYPLATTLTKLGHVVTSKWLNEDKETEEAVYRVISGEGSIEDLHTTVDVAEGDLSDIRACDVFIVLSHKSKPSPRGGMWREMGYAYAMVERGVIDEIWLVGDKVSHFDHVMAERWFRNCKEVEKYVRQLEEEKDE